MKVERTDRLRRRPNAVRYFYLAVSNTTIHTGLSYGGLEYAHKNHRITELHVADLVTGKVRKVEESVENFMERWRAHYNDPDWDYEQEIELEIPAHKKEV